MNRGLLYYSMMPLVAVAALLQSSSMNRLEVAGVKPDLVLILVLIGTLIYGSRIGVVWAFFGGIMLDIFSGGPMGSSSLALMAACALAGLGHSSLSRRNMLVPVTAMLLGTVIYGFVYVGILIGLNALILAADLPLLRRDLPLGSMVQYVIGPSVLYNTTIMIALLPFLNRIPDSHEAVTTLG